MAVCGLGLFADAAAQRQTISLDGTWQIAEGAMNAAPANFAHTVAVPGLVDMAQPAFAEVGVKSARRAAFWYRRTFTLAGPLPAVATLKVGKAMFGSQAWLNGKLLGGHPPSFTAGLFNARDALKTGENELLIRVGADRDAVKAGVPTGFDYEKERYIPGIFDSVELVLTGTPHLGNVQVAPDVANQRAKVRLWLQHATVGEVTVEVCEVKTRRVVGSISARIGAEPEQVLDLTIPLAACQLWTPESPFLYELTARTRGDEFTTRFGMREFKFDPASGRALLERQAVFHARQQHHALSVFRGSQARRPAVEPPTGCASSTGASRTCTGTACATASASRRNSGIASPTRKASSSRTSFPSGTAASIDADGLAGEFRRVDARALEPSLRRHLGRQQRNQRARNRTGHRAGARTGPVEPAVGQRLGSAG